MLALKEMNRQSATQNDTEGTFMQPHGFLQLPLMKMPEISCEASGISTLKVVTRS